MYQDIREQSFQVGLRIVAVSRHLPDTRAGNVIAKQVLRSGTSIGAILEETVAAYSKEDYSYRMGIALREARETQYWLRLIEGMGMVEKRRVHNIMVEADELRKILGTIVSKLRGTSQK